MSRLNKIKRIIAGALVALLLLVQGPVGYALAVPTPPSAPTAPFAPEAPEGPQPPPEAPIAPDSPTAPGTSGEPDANLPPASGETLAQEQPQDEGGSEEGGSWREGRRRNRDGDGGNTGAPSEQTSESQPQPEGVVSDGNVGETTINTGNADNSANILNSANSNLAGGDSASESGEGGGITVVNDGNGSGSDNTGSATVNSDSTTTQDNTARVVNNLDQDSTTGDNSASRNTGGDSTITTGDANVTGTIINSVNTNVDGVMVAEFNVADDHVGDILLDFGSGCISGCGVGDVAVVNSGNGDSSTNTGTVDSTASDTTFQNNDATIENNLTLEANSGDNWASRNTGGDSTIETGDANVSANLLTFANTNIVGGVVYSVVNIFGDLIGDIIFPENVCCLADTTVKNVGNGDGSTNTANVNLDSTDTTTQTNDATILNNLNLDATTGGNDVSRNTNGTNSVTTGDASIDAQLLNIANTNIAGGLWWLVIVNEAGKWVGKILGSDGNFYGGSDGFEFTVNDAGEVAVTNSGNGAGSTNTGTVNQTTNNTTEQTNTANIVNNVDLSANTGGNSASRNTGGNNSITTGDASIIANIVNFVNNNISGGGMLFVNVVNVFGSWLGDFVGPGQHKDKTTGQLALEAQSQSTGGVGGESSNGQSQSSSSGGTGGNGGSSGSSPSDSSEDSDATAGGSSTTTGGSSIFASILNTKVAGFRTADSGTGFAGGETTSALVDAVEETAKTINFNLAWLIFLIPFGLGIGLVKKKLLA